MAPRLPHAAPPGSRSRLPANAGTVLGKVPRDRITGELLSPLERRVLDEAGWKAGDPLPDLTDTQLARRVTAEAQQIASAAATNAEGLTPVPPDTPPVVPPEARDISELSPEERQAVYKTMAELSEVRERLTAAKSKQATTPDSAINMDIPGMAQAAATVAQAESATIPVVDDLNTPPAPAINATPPSPTTCPRCGLHLHEPNTMQPTHDDVLTYVQAILGGQRFVKRFQLFGGHVSVVFRGLTVQEEAAIKAQLRRDVDSGTLNATSADVRIRRAEYRMALGIAEFTRRDQDQTLITEANDYHWTQTDACPSVVVAMWNDINNQLFRMATVRRAVAFCWSQFWEILKHMEVKANDPDFYNAIEMCG